MNHGYNTPEEGAIDWHIPLNSNFEQLDTDVEVRDVESARSDYEPKQGAKFLATDTGNRFVGDGDGWRSVPYPTSVQGGGLPMPDEHTLASINDAIATHDCIRLEPGATYRGDTTISIDSRDRDVYVYAGGSTIEYTGEGVCVFIEENYTSGYRGRVHWNGGWIVGPSHDQYSPGRTGIGFRIQDSFGHELSPDRLVGWQWGIELRNVEQWSEGNYIHDILQVQRCDRFVRFNGAGDTGGGGTSSFRFTRIHDVMGEITAERWIEMTPETSMYDSTIMNLTAFLNYEPASMITLAGQPARLRIIGFFAETGSTDGSNSYLIEVDGTLDGGIACIVGGGQLGGINWSNGNIPVDGWNVV